MSTNPLLEQIYDQLASARCEQDLDNQSARIPEPHWHLFMEHMLASIKELEEQEPQRAKAMRSQMHTYLARWHHKKSI
jgi:hypothetical protein